MPEPTGPVKEEKRDYVKLTTGPPDHQLGLRDN